MRRRALGLAAAALIVVTTEGAATPRPVTFPGVGAHGVFDPSLEAASGRVWMSYSAVEGPIDVECAGGSSASLPRIETRLAASDDRGATWADVRVVNAGRTYLLASPEAGGRYVGCRGFELDLTKGRIAKRL